MSEIGIENFVCRDKIMVRPPAAGPRSKVMVASSANASILQVEVLVGTAEYPRGSVAAVEGVAIDGAQKRAFGSEEVIVVPLTHVLAVAPPPSK